jgi:hypothetical protein
VRLIAFLPRRLAEEFSEFIVDDADEKAARRAHALRSE